MHSTEDQLEAIREELQKPKLHQDVVGHYEKLEKAIRNPEFGAPKILVFQPVSIGDSIISSLSAELFKIKYPGCTVDYMISNIRTKAVLETNPFIDNVILEDNWGMFRERDTNEEGELAKKYDISYGLYWWQGSIIKSFLEDLGLPTDYTRVTIYKHKKYNKKAKELWCDMPRPRIAVQSDMGTSMYNGMPKWNKDFYPQLMKGLAELGTACRLGSEKIETEYPEDIEVIREADILVCSHGSIEHAAAAVGCQTVSMSTIFDPSLCMAASYQNKYLPTNKQHVIVKPQNWCQDYNRCITTKPLNAHHEVPPYGFPHKFPPHMYKPCDFGFKYSCVHEINPDYIVQKVKETLANV